MVQLVPHYLLFTESKLNRQSKCGYWRFTLQRVYDKEIFEVKEEEQNCDGERLELLSVLRGLEALDQPSSVIVVTSSRSILKGFRHCIDEWRENNWCWERFGEMRRIKNCDLWQRIDRSLRIHAVECRCWNYETAISLARDSWFKTSPPQQSLSTKTRPSPINVTRWGNRRWSRFTDAAVAWALWISGIEIVERDQNQYA